MSQFHCKMQWKTADKQWGNVKRQVNERKRKLWNTGTRRLDAWWIALYCNQHSFYMNSFHMWDILKVRCKGKEENTVESPPLVIKLIWLHVLSVRTLDRVHGRTSVSDLWITRWCRSNLDTKDYRRSQHTRMQKHVLSVEMCMYVFVCVCMCLYVGECFYLFT